MYGLKPVPFKKRQVCLQTERFLAKNCLDIGGDWVSHAGMRCNWVSLAGGNEKQLANRDGRDARNSRRDGQSLRGACGIAGAMLLCLFASGCMKPLTEHTAALAAATAPVVDQASAAYKAANAIHDESVNYLAIREFEKPSPPNPVYNPKNDTPPLLTPAQLDARLAVLKALQCYVQALVAVTSEKPSPELDAAAKSLGASLTTLANKEAPSVESALGVVVAPASTTLTTTTTTSGDTTSTTSSSSSTPPPAITPGMQNAFEVGLHALGQYLMAREVKKTLPGIVTEMDPQVKAICELLAQEIDILSWQEKIDYDTMIDLQTEFLRRAKTLDEETRREQIVKLPELARQKRATSQQLAQLRGGLVSLELTHHALAAELAGNNPESIKQKLGDLEAAGGNLGKFYSSLTAAK